MLPEQIGKCFIRQFLQGPHPVAPELCQLVVGIVVEGDQFAQTGLLLATRHPLPQWQAEEIVPVRNRALPRSFNHEP